MSSEARAVGPLPVGRASYRRGVVVAVLVLAVLAGGLTAVAALRPPRVTGSRIDQAAVIVHAEERWTLELDRPVRTVPARTVTMTPETDLTVRTSGRQVIITFGHPLDSATRYTVRIAGVRGTDGGPSGAVTGSFTTATQSVVILDAQSAADGADRLLRRVLSTGTEQVVFTAPRIREYAALPRSVIAATADVGFSSTLHAVDLSSGHARTVPLPARGTVTQVHASPAGGIFGFVFTETSRVGSAKDGLYTWDPRVPGARPMAVLPGGGGAVLPIVDWGFVPGTSAVVLQRSDQSVSAVQTVGRARPASLGTHAEIRGYLPGRPVLVLADPTRASAVDLTTGRTIVLRLPSPDLADGEYSSDPILLGRGSDYLQSVFGIRAAGGALVRGSRVQVVGRSMDRTIYTATPANTVIRSVCLSPNGQYAAVLTQRVRTSGSGESTVPTLVDPRAVVVDVSTGRQQRIENATDADWCDQATAGVDAE